MKRLTNLWSQERSFLLFLPAVLWQTMFMVAPVLLIAYFSFVGTDFALTLDHYRSLIKWPYFAIIFRSLFLAGLTAILSLFIAYPVAYFLAIRVQRYKNICLFFLTLPFWINFLVQIYAWYFLLERNGLINTVLVKLGIIAHPVLLSNKLFAIFIVMVYCYLPFMIMPLYSIIEKIDRRLFEVSADLGATPWQTFRRVTLPLSMPGIRTGLLLVLIPTFGEFVIPSLLGGSKYMLVGSLISFFFLGARDKGGGSAFTCMSGGMLIGILMLLYLVIYAWQIRKTVRGL